MIDKRGRIFGKINIIDLVVVILVVCLAGGLIYNMFLQKDGIDVATEKETGIATITFTVQRIEPNWVAPIKEGDKLIIEDTVTDVEIISVVRKTAITTTTTSEGKIIEVEDPTSVDCTIVVKGSANRDALGVSIMGQLYRINDGKEIRTDTYALTARVNDIQFEPAQ